MLITLAAVFLALLLAGHMAFWRTRSLRGLRCALVSRGGAKLDKSLLDSLQQLRYEESLLEAERESLLDIGFSRVRDFLGCSSDYTLGVFSISQSIDEMQGDNPPCTGGFSAEIAVEMCGECHGG